MSDLIRDSSFGQLVRLVTRNKYLQYPEETAGFQLPRNYEKQLTHSTETAAPTAPLSDVESAHSVELAKDKLEKVETQQPEDGADEPGLLRPTLTTGSSRRQLSRSQTRTRNDLERAVTAASMKRGATQEIMPTRLDDGTVLVDWYTTDDPADPENWSLAKKFFVTFQVCIYTTAVYMGSSIYTPSETIIAEKYGVSLTVASLGLALYVLAYGIGPMLWSPLSEIPAIGRNPPYILSFGIFVILCVPTALVDNVAGLLVLRFLQGFFGSPCLATGGASVSDLYSIIKAPYAISTWGLAATFGPALGPLISGFSVAAENWRWSLWEMLWLAGPIWLVMFFFLPETSQATILLHRARRLRKALDQQNLRSQSEIDQEHMSISAVAFEALWRPMELMILDPSIGFTAVYTALIYGIYYSFFEAFPDVYIDMYGFNVGEMGLIFLSIGVGVFIAMVIYWAYNWWIVEPDLRKNGFSAPEPRLIPAIIASFLLPIGLFIFAWTSNPSIPWIASVIGILVFSVGIFIVIQCIFVYLPFSYPQYAASLFAGNDVARSSLAFAAVLFSRPMFAHLGIGPGVSLLAALTAACIAGLFVLYLYGHKLRARSRFAPKD